MEYYSGKRTKHHTADVDIKSYCCVVDSKYYPLWKTLTSKTREIKLLWATCCSDVVCYFSLTGSWESPRLFYPGRNVCLLSPILASLSFWPWSSPPYPTAKKHKSHALNIQTSHSSAFFFRLIPPLDVISKKREQINNCESEESIRITDKLKPYKISRTICVLQKEAEKRQNLWKIAWRWENHTWIKNVSGTLERWNCQQKRWVGKATRNPWKIRW